MNADQITRLERLRDKLVDRALIDADPVNWTAGDKRPADMTAAERGDTTWCRRVAVQTISLAMQVQRLVANPMTGGAAVPGEPAREPHVPDEESMESEVARYEAAAAQVLAGRAVKQAKDGSRAKR
jgi:hypothetical protein